MAAEWNTEWRSAWNLKPTQEPAFIVKLVSSDGLLFEVEATGSVALMSPVVKAAVEDCGVVSPIPIRDVNSQTLQMVIEYCAFHSRRDRILANGLGMQSAAMMAWDAQFVNVEVQMLTDLFWAADSMKIKNLRDLTSRKVCQLIEQMPLANLKKNFSHHWITRDIDTPEKEAMVREELRSLYSM